LGVAFDRYKRHKLGFAKPLSASILFEFTKGVEQWAKPIDDC
jgi:hypothetical protein